MPDPGVHAVALALTALLLACACWAAPVLQPLDGEAPAGTVEIQGVSAGPFNPDWWQAGTLNWNFDARSPLIEPKDGRNRNIYAPTVVRDGDRWRIFYGAWDGVETGNDRIYSTWTEDFLSFQDRHIVIDHGVYIHVCNCCAIRLPSGEWRMMCTAYPHREGGLNRPAAFFSPDGLTWNGALPHVAEYGDLATIEGYPNWENADINGMNAILFEDGKYRLYFADFRNFTQIHRASSEDFRRFTYDGPVLDGACAVNDVKRFDVAGHSWYLMAMHMNGDQMWYSLSRDGMAFEPRRLLTRNRSDADRYMVAVGIVTDGVAVYGFLYGAGAEPHLAANRIFAKGLQKRAVLHTQGGDYAEAEALGPDVVRLRVPEGATTGSLEVFAEDGLTSLGAVADVALHSGRRYRLVQE